ncbi:hypothetical protein D9615_007086 [Tricholomella constricta]|uniref:Uncharacterized protein n=1 Tax=Tricholomella constricta TaxID=117010 RepID=A0A8H5H889_9AGAR|nr:hypothetical protein D9615_007086 [Tricholomella constricta]
MAAVLTPRSAKMSLERLINALRPVLAENFGVVIRYVPTLAKYLLCLLFLINVRSWPLMWHFRVFRPVFRIRLEHKLLQWRTMFMSRARKIQAEDEWLDSISPVGADPMSFSIKYNTWASIDDSDFNGHLSNSSYAKTMDSARFKAALAMFPMFFRAGGWMALAATHYNFIREIPILAPYEIRLSIGTWDQKWIYIIAKFVTKPKSKSKSKSKPAEQPTSPSSNSNSDTETSTLFTASLRTPADADAISTTGTPFPPSDTPTATSIPTNAQSQGDTPTPTITAALKAVVASLASEPEPDGAILHTISVSQCCFKVGRITVPPVLVLAVNGFSAPSPSPNAPPHWAKAKAVMSRPLGGSTRALHGLLKGGWRDMPPAERWWDQAMGGVVEERRRRALEVVQALGLGMGGVRNL